MEVFSGFYHSMTRFNTSNNSSSFPQQSTSPPKPQQDCSSEDTGRFSETSSPKSVENNITSCEYDQPVRHQPPPALPPPPTSATWMANDPPDAQQWQIWNQDIQDIHRDLPPRHPPHQMPPFMRDSRSGSLETLRHEDEWLQHHHGNSSHFQQPALHSTQTIHPHQPLVSSGAATGIVKPRCNIERCFPGGETSESGGAPTQMRRKNASRESTSTLKAWLTDHMKNPYPNKGEKVMLAIVTKMTLTQVSTWFANARRRLKKENMMTWTPRNRSEDDNDDQIDSPMKKSADDLESKGEFPLRWGNVSPFWSNNFSQEDEGNQAPPTPRQIPFPQATSHPVWSMAAGHHHVPQPFLHPDERPYYQTPPMPASTYYTQSHDPEPTPANQYPVLPPFSTMRFCETKGEPIAEKAILTDRNENEKSGTSLGSFNF